MCVGWGYGSNMLTKYLSESGEEAAITATICIDSPFDLDEITKSYPHCVALDQKLAHGFMDILHANKVIYFFQLCGLHLTLFCKTRSIIHIEKRRKKKKSFVWWKS